ncbi:MAG: flavin reductase, partial [Bacilli bacterium]
MSQPLEAFLAGCNIIAFQKNDYPYGMCCAWAQMVDTDKITLLLGSQSTTAKHINIGDEVGVSALSTGQKAIAWQLGENHSEEMNKLVGIPIQECGSAILIPGAKVLMICKVLERLVLTSCPNDYLFLFQVISYRMDTKKTFL